jgi:hypothetical protein
MDTVRVRREEKKNRTEQTEENRREQRKQRGVGQEGDKGGTRGWEEREGCGEAEVERQGRERGDRGELYRRWRLGRENNTLGRGSNGRFIIQWFIIQ